MLAKIFKTLSSQKVIKSVSLTCSFCIDPYMGFISLVIGNPWINWLISFSPDVELNIPENATVFGRYGGKTEFNLSGAHHNVIRVAKERPDIFFYLWIQIIFLIIIQKN